LIGAGGVFFSLLLCCALGYFVVLPRFHDSVENEVTRVLSTEVAERLDVQLPGTGEVPPGEYRISLTDLQRQISGGSDNLQVEGMDLRAEGQDIVLAFEVTNASATYRFTPVVGSGGTLELSNMRGEGGIVEQILSPGSLGNAIENSVNDYLDVNGLVLEEVYLDGQELVLNLASQ
jgi:hypothetical protein